MTSPGQPGKPFLPDFSDGGNFSRYEWEAGYQGSISLPRAYYAAGNEASVFKFIEAFMDTVHIDVLVCNGPLFVHETKSQSKSYYTAPNPRQERYRKRMYVRSYRQQESDQ